MNRVIGKPLRRLEDPRLLTGGGRYMDDIALPGMLHVAFVRSEHAHALIGGIDAEAARAAPGVRAVFTMADFPEFTTKRMPQIAPIPAITAEITTPYPLALDEVCFVGEPIAIVVAQSRAEAEDAAQLVAVDYTPLPAVTTPCDTEGLVWRNGAADNQAGLIKGGYGDVAGAFSGAERVVSAEITSHRGGGHSMEGRGVIASYEAHSGRFTLWTSTQIPHTVRRSLALYLGVDENKVRVAAPDVGGGFGPKGVVYPEEIALALASRAVCAPLKWIEDRREHFFASVQQRDQVWRAEMAFDADGGIRGVRLKGINDCGAYLLYGLLLPLNTVMQFPGPYRWPALELELEARFTNLTPTSPVRGAGRPYANFVMERLMDLGAHEFAVDPAEFRARHLVTSDMYPWQSGMKNPAGFPITHDSGSNDLCLAELRERCGYDGFPARQEAARSQGRYLGLGLALYTEDSGIPPFEGATVRIEPNGRALVETGAASQGQGHDTIFAQICAEILGIAPETVQVRSADTDLIPRGIGTLGSRIAVTAGNSVLRAAQSVRDKALRFASFALGVEPDDLELRNAAVHVRGDNGKGLSLSEISKRLNGATGAPMPPGFDPGLESTEYATMTAPVFSNGAVAVEVEVDPETGRVEVSRCTFVHDCGRMLNPLLVEGQVIGGAVHGIGNALFERMIYDRASGQPLTTNYGEYLLPTATEMPQFEVIHLETPSPANPLGAKGVGESGTIPMASAVVAALENALQPFDARFTHHPVGPEEIVRACMK